MKIIGHRGARGLAAENTLASFEKALKHHVDQIEFDLRTTMDGIAVLNHNRDIRDSANNKFIIRTHTLKQLREYKSDLMTFEELLDIIDHHIHLLVIIEHWSGVRASWRAHQLGAKRINMRSWWLWRGFLRGMYRHGYQIAPYTININNRRVQKWRPYIYGVITDYPDRFSRSKR
jgi:glycerophosphoryl diester phosphodiesterase